MVESTVGSTLVVCPQDPEIFRGLYERHQARVYALAWRMCGDPRQAEDLTQDVFIRLWNAMPSFRGESAFGTWLHRLAVNVIWTAVSNERRSNGWLESVGDADQSGSESHFEAIANQLDLERALSKLPHGARTILLLYSVEGYSYREISIVLSIDIGTVKSQLHRARRLLLPLL